MLNSMILILAFGRFYASIEAAMMDWQAGKDFRLMGHSCYTSIRDLPQLQAQLCTVYIRLENLKVSITVSNHH